MSELYYTLYPFEIRKYLNRRQSVPIELPVLNLGLKPYNNHIQATLTNIP